MDGIIDSMDMSLSKLQEMVKDGEAWRCSPRGCKEPNTTEGLNNNIHGILSTGVMGHTPILGGYWLLS